MDKAFTVDSVIDSIAVTPPKPSPPGIPDVAKAHRFANGPPGIPPDDPYAPIIGMLRDLGRWPKPVSVNVTTSQSGISVTIQGPISMMVNGVKI